MAVTTTRDGLLVDLATGEVIEWDFRARDARLREIRDAYYGAVHRRGAAAARAALPHRIPIGLQRDDQQREVYPDPVSPT